MYLRGDFLDLLHSHNLHNAKLPCNLTMTFEIVRNVRFVSIKSVRVVDLVFVNVQICIRKKGLQNFVHMSNLGHSSSSSINSTSLSPVSVKTVSSLFSFFFSVVF